MSEEWGPWIEHDGGGIPAGIVGNFIHAVMNKPTHFEGFRAPVLEYIGFAQGNAAAWVGTFGFIVIRYRIRKPRALLNLIEMVQNLPAPSKPKVPA